MIDLHTKPAQDDADRRCAAEDARILPVRGVTKPPRQLGAAMAALILAILWTCGLAIGVWMAKRQVETALGQFDHAVRARALGARGLSPGL